MWFPCVVRLFRRAEFGSTIQDIQGEKAHVPICDHVAIRGTLSHECAWLETSGAHGCPLRRTAVVQILPCGAARRLDLRRTTSTDSLWAMSGRFDRQMPKTWQTAVVSDPYHAPFVISWFVPFSLPRKPRLNPSQMASGHLCNHRRLNEDREGRKV